MQTIFLIKESRTMKQKDILKVRTRAVGKLIKATRKQIRNYHKILATNEKLYRQNKIFIKTYAEDAKFDLMQDSNEQIYNTTKINAEKKIKAFYHDLKAYNKLLAITGNNERNN